MDSELYTDKQIEISESSILIRKYYYPFGSRRVELADIEAIYVYEPSLVSGKYRYWGTGNFRTWFPPDKRSKRDKIFVIKLKRRWWRIGFTVEDSQMVLNVLTIRTHLIDYTESQISKDGANSITNH